MRNSQCSEDGDDDNAISILDSDDNDGGSDGNEGGEDDRKRADPRQLELEQRLQQKDDELRALRALMPQGHARSRGVGSGLVAAASSLAGCNHSEGSRIDFDPNAFSGHDGYASGFGDELGGGDSHGADSDFTSPT